MYGSYHVHVAGFRTDYCQTLYQELLYIKYQTDYCQILYTDHRPVIFNSLEGSHTVHIVRSSVKFISSNPIVHFFFLYLTTLSSYSELAPCYADLYILLTSNPQTSNNVLHAQSEALYSYHLKQTNSSMY